MEHLFRSNLSETLPSVRVTETVRKEVEQIANDNNISISEVQRAALRFFLSNYDTKRINDDTFSKVEEVDLNAS